MASPPQVRMFTKATNMDSCRLHYWFDHKDKDMQSLNPGEFGQVKLNTKDLPAYLHTLFVQVRNGEGVVSSPQACYFKRGLDVGKRQLQYWFDHDAKGLKTIEMDDNTSLSLDVNHLSEELHLIHMQVMEGKTVSSAKAHFFVRKPLEDMDSVCYWFDEDRAHCKKIEKNGIQELDASALSDGLHLVQVQVVGKTFSTVVKNMFWKIPNNTGDFPMICETSIDQKLHKKEDIVTKDGILDYNLDLNQVNTGFHTLQMNVRNRNTGAVLGTTSSMFLRVPTLAEINSMKCFYRVDQQSGFSEATHQENGLYHFTFDVNQLRPGLHTIACMLAKDYQHLSSVKTAFFLKQADVDADIVGYSYWFNNNVDNSMYVQLEKPVRELFLKEVWKAQSFPIRSSMFHFEYVDQVPYVFAKNEVHARFFNHLGGKVEASSTFVDYKVSEKLDTVSTIHVDETKTIEELSNEKIQWYRLSAQAGDSVTLVSNHKCDMHLFDRAGKDLLAVGEDKAHGDSIGCLILNGGIFYLALHDADASYDEPTTVTYLSTNDGENPYDVNEDLLVNEEDYQLIVDYYLGKPVDVPMERLDVNGDGIVDVQDAVLVQKNFTGVHEGILNVEP